MRSGNAYRWHGYVRLGDYLAERLGVGLRTAQELMRTEEALSRLPLTLAAFSSGEITAAHVRLLTRIATAENEAFWLSRARWMDVRRLSRVVVAALRREAGEKDGVAPGGAGGFACDATDPFEEPDRVPLEMGAPAWLYRWWRETVVLVRQLVGRALGPGECLEVVLSESASGSGALLVGTGDCTEAGAESTPETAQDCVVEAGGASAQGQPSEYLAESQDTPSQRQAQECLAGTGTGSIIGGTASSPEAAQDCVAGAGGASTSGESSDCFAETGADSAPAGAPSQATTGDLSLPEGEARCAACALDRTLRDLVASRQRHEAELADHLVRVRADGSFLDEGCRSLEGYAREQLGLSPRQMYYLLALHRTLERVPDLRRAFVAGRLTLRQVLLCGRVATTATAGAWLRRAEVVTLRRLYDEVEFWELLRNERPEVWGVLEGGPIPSGIVLVPGHRPRLHSSACGDSAPAESGGGSDLTDAGLHESASGARPSGVDDDLAGRQRCDLHGCASGDSDARSLTGPTNLNESELHASARAPRIDARSFLAALEADERALPMPVRRCTIKMWTDPDTRRDWSESVAAFRSRSTEPLEEWEVLALHLREFWSVWDNKITRKQRREHPTVERDGWRCTAPGCWSVGTARLHEHHIVFKSRGGELTAPDNLTTLCRGHHLGLLHENKMRCTGTAPDELLWEFGVARGEEPLHVFRDEHRIGGTAV